jgi:hypothetical protein
MMLLHSFNITYNANRELFRYVGKMKKVRVKHPGLVLTHLIPDRVEIGLDGFRLLLVGVTSFRNQLDLDVGVAQSVRVHRDQVSGLNH